MNKIALIFLSFWFSLNVFSQGNRVDVEERYRSQKIAFLTDKLQLTPEEAEKFWPLYRSLEARKDDLAVEMRNYRATFPENEQDLSEAQARKLLEFHSKHLTQMSKLLQEYQGKFLSVISAKKLLLLNDAESEFRKHLLREFKGRGANHTPR
ncbi:MAG TPA: hypothetical protein DCG69_11790 [Bacteroidales bacterium]|nr:hypothetical protein [Bacteroidales bacterium]